MIMDALAEKGYGSFIVGGCVRDSLLGIVPKDWDICTGATPEEMKECFAAAGFCVAETGVKHGTLTAILNHEPFEVTTYRTEGGYSDFRRPDSVEFCTGIEEDLVRRDFTINAMAYSEDRGLVDICGGREDLERGVLRCVGDPEKRFREDALRIMRCVRFSSQLGFTVAPRTREAMDKTSPLLAKIAVERVREEFVRTLCGKAAGEALRRCSSVIEQFIPEIGDAVGCNQQNDYHIYDVWEHIIHVVENIPDDPVLRLAAFFHDIGKPKCKTVTDEGWGHFYRHEQTGADMTRDIMNRMKFDNNTKSRVVKLVDRHGIVFNPAGRQPRRLLVKLGPETLKPLIELERADVKSQAPMCIDERLENIKAFEAAVNTAIEEEACFSVKDLAVDGRDLIRAGVPPGRKSEPFWQSCWRMSQRAGWRTAERPL